MSSTKSSSSDKLPYNPLLKTHANEIRRLGKRAVEDIIEIGRRLVECKEIVGHGGWLPWLDREFGWKEQTARNFMQVYELSLKSPNFGDLDLPISVLYLLAAPSTPPEVRAEIVGRAEAGEQVSVAETQEAVEKAKRKCGGGRHVRHQYHPGGSHRGRKSGLKGDHTGADPKPLAPPTASGTDNTLSAQATQSLHAIVDTVVMSLGGVIPARNRAGVCADLGEFINLVAQTEFSVVVRNANAPETVKPLTKQDALRWWRESSTSDHQWLADQVGQSDWIAATPSEWKPPFDERGLFLSLLGDLGKAIDLARDPAPDTESIVARLQGLGERLIAAELKSRDATRTSANGDDDGLSIPPELRKPQPNSRGTACP